MWVCGGSRRSRGRCGIDLGGLGRPWRAWARGWPAWIVVVRSLWLLGGEWEYGWVSQIGVGEVG